MSTMLYSLYNIVLIVRVVGISDVSEGTDSVGEEGRYSVTAQTRKITHQAVISTFWMMVFDAMTPRPTSVRGSVQ